MGRKKRKTTPAIAETVGSAPDTGVENDAIVTTNIEQRPHYDVIPPPPPPPPRFDPRMRGNRMEIPQQQQVTAKSAESSQKTNNNSSSNAAKKMSSGYATTSHSAEIIDEDIYVSDGSESDEDLMADKIHMISEQNPTPESTADDSETTASSTNITGRSIEMVLSGSKMGLMRRGIHRPQQLVQPNRQWARQAPTQQDSETDKSATANDGARDGSAGDTGDDANDEERRKREQEEELAKLDPAQRAARLLAEKQRKLEEAKILARKLESEENAGRDPCLFSKRTSFDIRFDQIDDKPWLRGAGDITDFFNYGFSEEDWLEYGEQQLLIRQELIDANRQKRAPDPSIVPVIPKKPKKQNPRVAVSNSSAETTEEGAPGDERDGTGDKDEGDESSATIMGPVLKKNTKDDLFPTENDVTSCEIVPKQGPVKNESSPSNDDAPDIEVGVGGAWGVGAAPGSILAKLIEEQEKQQQEQQDNVVKQDDETNTNYQETTHDPREGRGNDHYGDGKNKYDNNSAPSYYGSGGGDSGAGHNNNQPDKQNDHHYGGWNKNDSQQGDDNRYNGGDDNRNHRYQNHGGHNDRNNNHSGGNQNQGDWKGRRNERGTSSHHQQQYNQGWNDGGSGGYRDGDGHRGGGSRRGGGGGGGNYGDGKGRGRGGNSYGNRGGERGGDRGGYQRRKRGRDDYDDRYSRR